jgi:predicted anti-sigma-YlaC factor YlaD
MLEVWLPACRSVIRFDSDKPDGYRHAVEEHIKECTRCQGFRQACGEAERQLAQPKA